MTFPKVSVGLPVFNGERYLEQALDSILAQTYPEFEVILSDNASTDRTMEICRAYAARDPRIRYSRNEVNIGGFRNNNRVIDLATGKYFLLTGHDDLRDPTLLTRCVEVLESDERVVLCYCRTTYIDAHGDPLPDKEVVLRLDSADPAERFRELIRADHKVESVYGVIRCAAMRGVRFGQFADADRVFVAAIGLRGPFHRIPDRLFFRREHALKSTSVYSSRYARTAWFDPTAAGRVVFPYTRQCVEYVAAVANSGLGAGKKIRCYLALLSWMRRHWRRMLGDFEHLARRVLRPLVHVLRGQRS